MGLHTATQLYSACFDLLGVAVESVLHMRRDVKDVLGKKIIEACVWLDLYLRDANMADDKEPHILLLLQQLEVIELLSRRCRDSKYLPIGHYTKLIEHTQSIGRQANGWRNSVKGVEQQRLSFDR